MRIILYILSVVLVFFTYIYEDLPCSKGIYEPNPDNRPFNVITSINHGHDLVPSGLVGSVGEVPLPVPGIPGYKPKPSPKSRLSKGSFRGIQNEWGFEKHYNEIRSIEKDYHTVKRENLYELDEVFAEYSKRPNIGFVYFVRFRIKPDGSIEDVDVIYEDHGYKREIDGEENNLCESHKGLPDSINAEGLTAALLAELAGWRFPQSERVVTHYCWLRYTQYENNK